MANGHNLIVAFDLVHPLVNYERVVRTMSQLGNAVKLGSMLWYLDTPGGAREAEFALKPALNPGDSMTIVDASTNYAVLHNLPIAGSQVRRFWNSATSRPSTPEAVPEPRGVPGRAPVPPPADISDEVAARLGRI